jgi:phosphoketolase
MALVYEPALGGIMWMMTRERGIPPGELGLLDAYWRAANYLSVGQIYLLDNPLLREPLRLEHVKPRLLGHWGTTPGLNLLYVHMNRAIGARDLNAIYVTGPGHGGPGLVANTYLEGTYTEVYPHIGEDEEGMRRLFRQFSFPGGIPSHVAPETPGSIHEGGELGYALVHAYGAVFDNPDLVALCVVGDGEAETGPLAGSWHSNVAGKQPSLDYLTIDDAIAHCTRGIGVWDWASSDDGGEPDVVLACAGDIPTLETLAAAALLREHLLGLRVRVVNVVDLMRLEPESQHPHGLLDAEFDALFTTSRPVIFAYHGYATLIHRLTYRRHNHDNMHVRGYKEEGTTTTPFDMVMLNDLDRFHLVMDVIDRVPALGEHAAGLRQQMADERLRHRAYTREHGDDPPDVRDWTWPGAVSG